MDPLTLGIILGGGALLGAGASVGSTAMTNEANKQLYYEMREWDKPINQVQRLKEANLNPNLAYGHGSVANTSPNAPTMQAPKIDLDVAGSVAKYQQIQNAEAQNRYIEQQVRTAKAQADVAQRDVRVLNNYDKTPMGQMVRSTDPFPFRVAGAGMAGMREALKQMDVKENPDVARDFEKGFEGRNYR